MYFEIESDINLKSLETAYDNIMKYIKNVSELRFALSLYVKALKVFYLKEYKDNSEFRVFVQRMTDEILSIGLEVDELVHPWELIYINMYHILDAVNDDSKGGISKGEGSKEGHANGGYTKGKDLQDSAIYREASKDGDTKREILQDKLRR